MCFLFIIIYMLIKLKLENVFRKIVRFTRYYYLKNKNFLISKI
jgi:hypothetical protein